MVPSIVHFIICQLCKPKYIFLSALYVDILTDSWDTQSVRGRQTTRAKRSCDDMDGGDGAKQKAKWVSAKFVLVRAFFLNAGEFMKKANSTQGG